VCRYRLSAKSPDKVGEEYVLLAQGGDSSAPGSLEGRALDWMFQPCNFAHCYVRTYVLALIIDHCPSLHSHVLLRLEASYESGCNARSIPIVPRWFGSI
jgi:hypothetical protein